MSEINSSLTLAASLELIDNKKRYQTSTLVRPEMPNISQVRPLTCGDVLLSSVRITGGGLSGGLEGDIGLWEIESSKKHSGVLLDRKGAVSLPMSWSAISV